MQIKEHRAAIELYPEDISEMVYLEQVFGIDPMKLEGTEVSGVIGFSGKFGKAGEGFPLLSITLIGGRTNAYIGDEDEDKR